MVDDSAKWYELAPKNIAEKAFEKLGKKEDKKIILKYSGHLKNFNSNARYNKNMIQFTLSLQWKDVDDDIQIGVIQSLIIRIYKIKGINTDEMKLYETFMKSLSKYAKKHTHDPVLEESFNRVNEQFFNGMMDKPNLIFASESFSKLGSYEYGTDTVYISTIFNNLPEVEKKFLDYVIYHELLHKKHSFNVKNGRHQAHTTAFRNDEKKFEENMESELSRWLRKKKYKATIHTAKSWFRLW
jgi:predicted metal-dependent hydrolase